MVKDGEDWHRLQTRNLQNFKFIFSRWASHEVDSLNYRMLFDFTHLKQFHGKMFIFKRSANLILNHLHNTTEVPWSGSHFFPRLVQKLNTDAKEFFKCEVHGEEYRVEIFPAIGS